MRSRTCQIKRQEWHAERKARYEQIQELKRLGKNIVQIARALGMSYNGVHVLFSASEYPVVQRGARGSGVEVYEAYLRQRWAEVYHNTQQLHRELVARGYPGSRMTVWRHLYPWRQADALATGKPLPSPPPQQTPKTTTSECP